MTDEYEIRRAVLADPSLSPIYADWLEDNGDTYLASIVREHGAVCEVIFIGGPKAGEIEKMVHPLPLHWAVPQTVIGKDMKRMARNVCYELRKYRTKEGKLYHVYKRCPLLL